MPILFDLLGTGTVKDKQEIVELLTGIAVGDHSNFLDGSLSPARAAKKATKAAPKSLEGKCYEAVRSRAGTIVDLLASREARVRAAAAFCLAWFRDPGRKAEKILLALAATERDPGAKVSMLLSLGHLGSQAARPLLERALETPGKTTPIQVAAAIGLAYIDQKKASEAVRSVLTAASAERGLHRDFRNL